MPGWRSGSRCTTVRGTACASCSSSPRTPPRNSTPTSTAEECSSPIDGQDVVGHVQVVDGSGPGLCEVKSMAVLPSHQRRGIGRMLMNAAIDLVAAESCTTLAVATAAADTGSLRFYQRLGFRMTSIERDAFTQAAGYPPGTRIDGIELRDRVWLTMPPAPRG